MKSLYNHLPAFLLLALAFYPCQKNFAQQLQIPLETVDISSDKIGDGGGKLDPPPPLPLSSNVEKQKAAVINFYPNPCHDRLSFNLAEDSKTSLILIYDILGHEVLKTKVSKANNSVDVSHLRPGVYIVRTPDGATRLEKN